MRNSYWKDIWRTIKKEKKRFLSIAVIATLGVTMMCGLRASCVDLRQSADVFFDEQKLFDIRVVSTLGISENDLTALENVEGVAEVEGGYSETNYFLYDGVRKSIEIHALSENGFNMPYLLEGNLPENEDEIVVTKKYQLETGNGAGDEIVLDDEPENLTGSIYKITGIIVDPMDINSTEGSMAFRSTATTDYVGYVIPEATDSEVYTAAYLMVEGSRELNCYTTEYEECIENVVSRIEKEIKAQREQARYEEVYNDAMEEWLDGKQEMEEEFAKADKEIADAEKELADGRQELNDGRRELEDGKRKIEDGREQIREGLAELKDKEQLAEEEFAKAEQEIEDGYKQISEGEKELEEAYETLNASQQLLDAGREELNVQEESVKQQFADGYAQIEAAENELYAAYDEAQQTVVLLEEQNLQIEAQMQDESISLEEKIALEKTHTELELQIVDAKANVLIAQLKIEIGMSQIEE